MSTGHNHLTVMCPGQGGLTEMWLLEKELWQ